MERRKMDLLFFLHRACQFAACRMGSWECSQRRRRVLLSDLPRVVWAVPGLSRGQEAKLKLKVVVSISTVTVGVGKLRWFTCLDRHLSLCERRDLCSTLSIKKMCNFQGERKRFGTLLGCYIKNLSRQQALLPWPRNHFDNGRMFSTSTPALMVMDTRRLLSDGAHH